MKQNNIKLSLLAVLATSSVYASGTIGYSSLATGGVTTTTKDAYAIFNNPSMLDKSKYTTNVQVGLGVSITENGLLDGLDNLDGINFEDAYAELEANAPFDGTNSEATKNAIINGQQTIVGLDGASANIDGSGEFAVNYENFALGYSYTAEINLGMSVNPNKTDLIVDGGSGNYFEYNPTNDTYSISNQSAYEASSIMYALDNDELVANLSAMEIVQVPLAYKTEYDGYDIGVAVKYLKGTYSHVDINPNDGSDNLSDKLEDSQESDTTFGLDLGVHKRYGDFDFSAVIKDINTPKFKYSNSFEYTIDPMAKIGAAYSMFDDDLSIAIDAQLNKTKNSLYQTETQMVNLGVSYEPLSWLGIKGGVKNNLAQEENDLGNIYTAGLNFGTKWIQVALAGEISTKKITIDDDEVSKYMGARFEIISRWGGE